MNLSRFLAAVAVFAFTMGLTGCCCHQKYYCGSTVSPAFCKPRHFHSCSLGAATAYPTAGLCDCGCP